MSLRIDPKYFNRFAIIVAIVSILLIAISTIYLHVSAKDDFYKKAEKEQDQIAHSYLKDVFKDDSVRVVDFRSRYVVLDFWSSYADPSLYLFKDLEKLQNNYPGKLTVIAASVRESRPSVNKYFKKNGHFPFRFVLGNDLYFQLKVPGLPTFMVYKPNGKLLYSHAGYRNNSTLKKLQMALQQQE